MTPDVGRSYLRVFDDATFDLLASYQLGPNEIPNAVASMAFGGSNGSSDAAAGGGAGSSAAAAAAAPLGSSREDEPPQFFIVGTAVIKPNVSCTLAVCSSADCFECCCETLLHAYNPAPSLADAGLSMTSKDIHIQGQGCLSLYSICTVQIVEPQFACHRPSPQPPTHVQVCLSP